MIGWCHEFTFYFGYTVFNKLKQRVKTMTLLDVQHVQKVYQTRFGAAEVTALKDINFSIEEGEYVAVMGESGSGKTTTINILTGQITADKGYSKILGRNSNQLTDQELKKIGLVTDSSGYYEKLTLYDNVIFFAK